MVRVPRSRLARFPFCRRFSGRAVTGAVFPGRASLVQPLTSIASRRTTSDTEALALLAGPGIGSGGAAGAGDRRERAGSRIENSLSPVPFTDPLR